MAILCGIATARMVHSAALSIPFENSPRRSVILVEVAINNRPRTFLLDTGCTSTLVSRRNERNVIVTDTDVLTETYGRAIDGVLGQDILREFETVTIDYRHRTIAFSPR